MMKKSLVALALSGLSLAGEAQKVEYLSPMLERFHRPKENASAALAVGMGSTFCGKVEEGTRKRLMEIWDMGEDRRMQALREWQKSIVDGEQTDDGTVVNLATTAKCWSDGVESKLTHDMISAHVWAMCSTPESLDSMRLRYFLDNLRGYIKNGPDAFLHVLCCVYNDDPQYINHHFSLTTYMLQSPLDKYVRLWNAPRENADYIRKDGTVGQKALLNEVLHDFDAFGKDARMKGIEYWGRTVGNALPTPLCLMLDTLTGLRQGQAAGRDVLAAIDKATDGLPPGMLGFVPRCKLSVMPDSAEAWKALDDAQAPLFLMPDTSAVRLPQWNDSLFGTQTTLKADTDALEKLLGAAGKEGVLPALTVFILQEADAVLPENYWRENMGVEGYDRFSSYWKTMLTASGVEIIVTNDGPRFNKNDPKLKAQAQALELALHRLCLKLARAEHQGKTAEVKEHCATLGELLTKYNAWPLLLNQYELRGVTPYAFVSLLGHYKGEDCLLDALISTTGNGLATSLGTDPKTGRLLPAPSIAALKNMFVVAGNIPASEEEKSKAAQTLLVMAQAQPEEKSAYRSTIQYLCRYGMTVEVEELLGDLSDEKLHRFVQGSNAYTGWCLVRRALKLKDTAKAEKILKVMTALPASYSYPSCRMAMADVARAKGRTEEAERLEQDTLVLAGFRIYRGGYNAYSAWSLLLEAGLYDGAEKFIWLIPRPQMFHLWRKIVDAAARAGHFEQAAFMSEKLLLLLCKTATPAKFSCSQADVAAMRAKANLYHALDLLSKGEKEKGENLLRTAQAQLNVCGREAPDVNALLQLTTPATEHEAEDASPLPEHVRYLTEKDAVPAGLKSGLYTWHITVGSGEDAERAVLRGEILSAFYESPNPARCWLNIVTDKGKHVRLKLNMLDPEDLDNLMDWKERNGFISCMFEEGVGNDKQSFDGKPLAAGIEHNPANVKVKGKWVKGGKYVVFLLPYGGTRREDIAAFVPEVQEQLAPLFEKAAADTDLKVCRTWREAKTNATTMSKECVAYFMGKRGGLHDRILARDILTNPTRINDLNVRQSILLCYMEENGEWDAAGREVLADLRKMGISSGEGMGDAGMMVIVRGNSPRPRFFPASILWPKETPGEWVPLQKAIEKKDAATVERLLKEDPALLHARFYNGVMTPLSLAMQFGNPATLMALVRGGVNPNCCNFEGQSLLYQCLSQKKNDYVAALLEAGADPHFPNSDSGKSLPLQACVYNLEGLKLLMKHGLDINGVYNGKPCVVYLTGCLPDEARLQTLRQLEPLGLDYARFGEALLRDSAKCPKTTEYIRSKQ